MGSNKHTMNEINKCPTTFIKYPVNLDSDPKEDRYCISRDTIYRDKTVLGILSEPIFLAHVTFELLRFTDCLSVESGCSTGFSNNMPIILR